MPLTSSGLLPDPQVLLCLSDEIVAAGVSTAAGGSVSGTYPVANTALFFPVRIRGRRTYNTAWWLNGAAVAGNVDVGIYTISGTTATRLATSTAAAQAGVSAMQTAAIGPVTVDPGLYYIAMSCTSVTSTFWRSVTTAVTLQFQGCFRAATSSPLPSSATVTSVTGAFAPMMGLSELSTI